MGKKVSKSENRVVTIPNILSLFRLCLIPLLVWLYREEQNYPMTAAVLVLSGITDLVDGFIARKFHMVSDLGKILDPVADKLTQIVMLYCLLTRYPYMLFTLVLLVCKEIFSCVTGLIAIQRAGKVCGADWHGKVTTTLFYAMMTIHLIWVNIPSAVSYALVTICTVMMIISLCLYAVRNIRMIVKRQVSNKEKT